MLQISITENSAQIMTKSTLDIHVPPLTQANGEDAKSGSRDRKLSICLRGYAFKECKE